MSEPDTPNVNPEGQTSREVNVKRLGQQQKEILRYFYSRRGRMQKQVEIIDELYGEVTDSRKASVSRSMKLLRESNLVYERTEYYSEQFDAWMRDRVRYHLTDAGIEFLERDDRFPEIEPGEDDCVECGDVAETYPDGTPYCHDCHDAKIRKEAGS